MCVFAHHRHRDRKRQSRKKEKHGGGLSVLKSKHLFFYRFNAKTVAIATQQSRCNRLSLSPPPLALLTGKVYRHPTPSDYDMFFSDGALTGRSLIHFPPSSSASSRRCFNKLLLRFQLREEGVCLLLKESFNPNPMPDETGGRVHKRL